MCKMSVSIYMKGYYEDFHALGRRKNKANSKPNKLVLSAVEWSQYVGLRPEILSMKFEILNKKHRSQMTAPEANLKRYELKKQSQL